jgi:hypothetical protein
MNVPRSEVPEEYRPGASPLMTARQKDYLLGLINSRHMTDAERADALAQIERGLSVQQASAWITRCQSLPKANSTFSQTLAGGDDPFPAVEPGRYAVMIGGTLKFFRIKIGKTESRWAGFIFIDAGRGGDMNGNLYWTPVKDFAYKRQILTLIATEPKKAMARFGQEVGSCGRCGRTLTDETSRARGIGPDCWEMM